MVAFKAMMAAEEEHILRSSEKRRLMIDLYDTNLTLSALADFVEHIERIAPRIAKVGIYAAKDSLRKIRKTLHINCSLGRGLMYFSTDMEEAKTWLISDS